MKWPNRPGPCPDPNRPKEVDSGRESVRNMVNKHAHQPTLNCRQVQDSFAAYLKGGLSPEKAAALRHHLLGCEACDQALQQARQLDNELRLEAGRARRAVPPLPPETSLHIQENVYRRMRRALFLQRTLQTGQQLSTVAALFLVVVLAMALFAPWQRQLANLSTAEADPAALTTPEAAPTLEAEPTPEPATPVPEPQPTVAPATPRPEPETMAPPRPDIIPLNSPAEAAQDIINSAIEAGDQEIRAITARTHPLPEASYRIWRRLERCQGQLQADDFDYNVQLHAGRAASVYVHYEGQYLGDVKLWLDPQGYWYMTTLNYSSFSALRLHCTDS